MSGTIGFNEIPSYWEVPGNYLEVRPEYQRAGILAYPARALIIAQKTSAGTATAGQIYENITRAEDASARGGPGSQLHLMAAAYLAANKSIPLDIIAVADAGSSTAAAWTLTFTASSNKPGTVAVNVAGKRVQIGATAASTATTLATAMAAAINANTALPVTATSNLGVVTVTAKNTGTAGNGITIVVDPAIGDTLPAGVTLAVAQTVTGATDPDIAASITAITDIAYSDVTIPWENSANTGAIAAETERRYDAMIHQDMRVHIGITGTLSERIAKAAALNARFLYASGLKNAGTPPWVIAATMCGICAQRLTDDPARQLRDIVLPDCVGPRRADLDDDTERHLLLAGGVSTNRVLRNGVMTVEKYVSTYRTNAFGALDPAWHDVMDQAVNARIRYDWTAYFGMRYPNNKLAPDGSLAAERDPNVVTPRRAKGSWGARSTVYAGLGWIVDHERHAREATFVVDPADRNRMNYRIGISRIGNLMVSAGVLAFDV